MDLGSSNVNVIKMDVLENNSPSTVTRSFKYSKTLENECTVSIKNSITAGISVEVGASFIGKFNIDTKFDYGWEKENSKTTK